MYWRRDVERLERNTFSTKTLVWLSNLSALGFVLMIMNTALPFFPMFLRIDLGDLPVLIAYRVYGLKAGISVAFMKNVLHLFLSQTLGIGELMNFTLSVTFILCLYFLSEGKIIRRTSRRTLWRIICLGLASITTAFAAVMANYFIMLPLYEVFLGITPEMILSMAKVFNPTIDGLFGYFIWILFPFNLLKFGVLAAIYYFIEKNLRSVV